MFGGDGEVETARAGGKLPVDGVGSHGVAATGTVLLSVDAVAVVAYPEREARLDQRARIGLELGLRAQTPELRSPGEDLCTRAAAELRGTQHVLPCGDGLLENLGANLAFQGVLYTAMLAWPA